MIDKKQRAKITKEYGLLLKSRQLITQLFVHAHNDWHLLSLNEPTYRVLKSDTELLKRMVEEVQDIIRRNRIENPPPELDYQTIRYELEVDTIQKYLRLSKPTEKDIYDIVLPWYAIVSRAKTAYGRLTGSYTFPDDD
jgi:hypothetical protein